MLERFKNAKMKEIEKLKILRANGQLAVASGASRPSFSAALRLDRPGQALPVIAEYKRASPSRGAIREDLTVEETASQYREGGAAALSVLTEEDWFKGDFGFLARAAGYGLPVLRKDFLFDPVQIEATAISPAAAILLIVRLTPDPKLLEELQTKAAAYGLECVVEVLGQQDLDLARASGAKIIQVNARDLQTLKVDRAAALRLIAENPPRPDELWIAASGIKARRHLLEAADAGFSAALVGTALMEQTHPGRALRSLIYGAGHAG